MAIEVPKNAIVPRVTGTFSSTAVNPGKTVTFTWSSTPTSTARLYLTGSGIEFVPSYALNGVRSLTVPMGAKVGTRIQVNWLATSPTGSIISGSATATVVATPILPEQVIYPIVSLDTNPGTDSIKPGQSTVISWQSSDTTKLSMSAPNWTVTDRPTAASTLSGNITATAPLAPALYNIKVTATSPTGLIKDFNFPVKVTAPALPKPTPVVPAITGVFTPNSVSAGGNAQLTWSTSNVTSMIMSSNDLTFRANTTSGNATISVPVTFTGSKVVINYTAGTADAQQLSGAFTLPIVAAANLVQPVGAPTVTFTIMPEYNPVTKPIPAGSPFTISWFSSNANTVTLTGLGLSTNQLTGILDLTAPTTPGTYYIAVNAVGPGGTNNNTEMFKVGVANIAVAPVVDPVIQMAFTPNTVNMGANTTLNWQVTGANAIVLNSSPQLTINSTTPTGSRTIAAPNIAGVYTANIMVTGSAGTVKTAQAILAVINPVALRIQPQVITLPDCTVGTPYNYSYSASGGLPPYKFAVALGALPYGLKLNPTTGVISGTPILTKVTVASFTISVTDSLNKIDRIDGLIKIK